MTQVRLDIESPKNNGDTLSSDFKKLQEISVKHINETRGELPLELSVYELMQVIFLDQFV